MQLSHLIVLLFALAISGASAGWKEDGCNEVICHKTGANESHANPRDSCSYCCCFESVLLGQHAEYRPCMYDSHYDPVNRKCAGKGCKSPETCEDIGKCTSDHSIPDPKDPNGCTFCCCENGYAKTSKCPNFGGYFGEFVESQNRCVPSKRCGKV